jgi:hypothetical protein
MSLYRKVPQCRVCRSNQCANIDRDLLQRMTYRRILEKYAALFPPEKELSLKGLKRHWKHMKDAVEIEAIARVKPLATLNDQYPAHGPEGQQVFEAAVQTRVNEIEVLEKLVISGLSDLERIGPKDGENEYAVMNRDRVRRNTASIVVDSAKVKQIAIQADEDRHRLERGRIVFRMFQLFGRALEGAPLEYRGVVASYLKEAIRSDDEINSLLKEQSSRPALPPGGDE